jgi:hypothetical protein
LKDIDDVDIQISPCPGDGQIDAEVTRRDQSADQHGKDRELPGGEGGRVSVALPFA